MASGDSSNPPTGSASNQASMPTSPPKYVPQFSATTEMILKRINSGATSSLSSIGITGMPPGYEDMRRSVLQGMKTSANMEIPATPPTNRRASTKASGTSSARATPTPGSGKGKGKATPKSRAGTKRKRVKAEESMSEEESEDDSMSKVGSGSDSDSSEEVVMLPKITQSGRQIVRPTQFVPQAYEPSAKRRAPSKKSQEQALCKRCGRGHSPNNNMIVFCDGCNGGWHQQCHDPHVSDDAIKDEDAPWFCAECSLKKGLKTVPVPESSKGVSWAGKSTEERREYLSSLPHPQLVSLLLQATAIHPSLPIFPPPPPSQNSKPSRAPAPFPPSAVSTAGLFSRSDANPNAPMNFIRKVQSPGPNSSSFPSHHAHPPQALGQQNHSAQANDDDSRESSPNSPPYPVAGKGLMAKLPPDTDDLEWLEDAGGSEAFSHMLFDAAENGTGTGNAAGQGIVFGGGAMGVGA